MLLVPGAPEIQEIESTITLITITWIQNPKDGNKRNCTPKLKSLKYNK